jgi:hypothetical protein
VSQTELQQQASLGSLGSPDGGSRSSDFHAALDELHRQQQQQHQDDDDVSPFAAAAAAAADADEGDVDDIDLEADDDDDDDEDEDEEELPGHGRAVAAGKGGLYHVVRMPAVLLQKLSQLHTWHKERVQQCVVSLL